MKQITKTRKGGICSKSLSIKKRNEYEIALLREAKKQAYRRKI